MVGAHTLHGALAHVEHLRRLCRVKQLVFGFPLPFLLVPCLADVPCDVRNLRHHLLVGGTFHCYHFHVQSFLFVSATKFGNKQKGDFLNHVDETLHIWQGKKYDTIFYRAGNDNDDIQGLVMARCKKQIQNGHTQYAFINATPVTTKRDRILLDDITELIHSSLKLSDFQQDLNPDYPSKRFVYGYAHDKEIYSLEVEGQKPDGVIEINVYDRVMYLWYYNDLQSNKRGDCLSYSVDVPK